VLVACILSLRTHDRTTGPAAAKPQQAPAAAATTGVSGGAPAGPQPTVPAGAKVVTFWIPWGQPERQKWVTDWGAKFHDQYPEYALKMEFVGFGHLRQRWSAANQAGTFDPSSALTSARTRPSSPAWIAARIATRSASGSRRSRSWQRCGPFGSAENHSLSPATSAADTRDARTASASASGSAPPTSRP